MCPLSIEPPRSPGYSWRGVTLDMFQIQNCDLNIQRVQDRYLLARSFNPLILVSQALTCRCCAILLLKNLDTETPIPYCYESRLNHRFEGVLTCSPPPIGTSTLILKTALVSKAAGVANDQEIQHALFPATEMIRHSCRETGVTLAKNP